MDVAMVAKSEVLVALPGGYSVNCQVVRMRVSVPSPAADAVAFAKTLGRSVEAGELRGTHRRPKRRYKKRIRMPSMLDPHVVTIEGWLAVEPQLTAIAIVGRLSENHPHQFCRKQHY
jgi:hypothetical protein